MNIIMVVGDNDDDDRDEYHLPVLNISIFYIYSPVQAATYNCDNVFDRHKTKMN